MNNRRQTIWLVSMLSLMVILSAYYLFTEPVSPAQNAGSGAQQSAEPDAAKAGATDDAGMKITEVDQNADGTSDPAAATDEQKDAAPSDAAKDGTTADSGKADGKTDEAAGDGSVSSSDEEVLNQLTNLKGSQYFDDVRRKNKEQFARTYEEQSQIVADTKRHSQDDAQAAFEKMNALEETDSRIDSLETKLMQDYENAAVLQEDASFKILVESASFNKKQAVKVIDQAAKELNVKPDRLSVEYVTP